MFVYILVYICVRECACMHARECMCVIERPFTAHVQRGSEKGVGQFGLEFG